MYWRIFAFIAKTEGTAGEQAELYHFIAEEAEHRNTSHNSVCEERGVSYNALSVFVDAGGNTRDTISRI